MRTKNRQVNRKFKRFDLVVFVLFILSINLPVTGESNPSTSDWQTSSATRLGWDTERLKQVSNKVNNKEFAKITSVLIAHKGKLIHEKYYNNGHVDYMNDLRSATKSITSLLIGLAIEHGHLESVEQKAFSLITDQQEYQAMHPLKQAITIQDLLSMSSILGCNDDTPYSMGNEERMYISYDWVEFVKKIPLRGYAPWEKRPEQSPYNRAFSYCTAGSFLLGAIIEKTSGVKMDAYAKQYLDRPLGIDSVKWNYSNHGITSGAGGTRYKSRDFLKFGELYRQGGKWNGQQVVNRDWIKESIKSRVDVRPNVEYGYFWWKFAFEVGEKKYWSYAASGNGGNYLFVQPELELVTLITSELYNSRQGHEQSQSIYSDYVLAAHPAHASKKKNQSAKK